MVAAEILRRDRGQALRYHVVPQPREPGEDRPRRFWVPSQAGRLDGYLVTLEPESCECEDRARHPDIRCKHIWAAVHFLRAWEERRAHALAAYNQISAYLTTQGTVPYIVRESLELLNPTREL
jgi:hypothetical protein